MNDLSKIGQLDWIKVWSTKYSFLNLCNFVPGYTTRSYELLEAGFNHILFKVENGITTAFRVDAELQNLSQAFAKRTLSDEQFLIKTIAQLKSWQDIILAKLTSAKFLDELGELEELNMLLRDFLSLYLVPLWTPDGLTKFDVKKAREDSLKKICLDYRIHSEHFYSDAETHISKAFKNKFGSEGWYQAMTSDELLHYVKTGEIPDEVMLQKRWNASLLYGDSTEKVLISGNEAKNFFENLEKVDDIKVLTGIVAQKGKTTGRVMQVTRNEDVSKITEGDILVTTMTRPEWIVAMQKASAFVTDAGGMLCHAAIIAREMKKPCVIGTKHATKVFKDGDMVEVDADNGVIRHV